MRRRSLIAGLLTAGALAGCLGLGNDDTGDQVSNSEHTIEYETRTVTGEPEWFGTAGPPPASPRLIAVRSAADADRLITADRLGDQGVREFIEATDYSGSMLLVVEFSLTAGFSFAVTEIERQSDRLRVVCRETDDREPDQEYPAVDRLHQSIVRIDHGGDVPDLVDGRFREAESDEPIPIEEHHPDDT